MSSKIGVFTSICEEDACWIDQYLAEIERLNLPFTMHFDRCSLETKRRFYKHSLCVGVSHNDDPDLEFNETHKQEAFNLLSGFDWAMAWDIDETWEKDAPSKLEEIAQLKEFHIDCPWFNLWNDKDHIRVDGNFRHGHRVKFYNLQHNLDWKFDHPITNGPKPKDNASVFALYKYNLVCLHHGMMTHELRVQHKERWDRIYTKAVGANPYGFWDDALDPNIKPTLIRHEY